MTVEISYSPLPIGVHVRMDCVEGPWLAYEISDGINSLHLRS